MRFLKSFVTTILLGASVIAGAAGTGPVELRIERTDHGEGAYTLEVYCLESLTFGGKASCLVAEREGEAYVSRAVDGAILRVRLERFQRVVRAHSIEWDGSGDLVKWVVKFGDGERHFGALTRQNLQRATTAAVAESIDELQRELRTLVDGPSGKR